jgi:protein-S-isoprenylcysteine O-methyltransferase Ste14
MSLSLYIAGRAFAINMEDPAANSPMAVLLLFAATLLDARIDKEHRMMLERFGGEYLAYMRRTGRLPPRTRIPQ